MAEDIAWLHEHTDGGSKLVLWAHNVHIETVKQGSYTRRGQLLHAVNSVSNGTSKLQVEAKGDMKSTIQLGEQ